MGFHRLVLVLLVIVLAVSAAGCSSANGTTASRTATTEETSASVETSAAGEAAEGTATAWAHSITEDGIALGADMQRDRDWRLGAKIWAMTTSGKSDMKGRAPQLAVTAIKKDGSRSIVWSGGAADGLIGAQQQSFILQRSPSMTTTLVVTTTLKRQGGNGQSPLLTVPLGDVPAVPTLFIGGDGTE